MAKTYRNDWAEFTTGFSSLMFKYAPAGYFDSRHMVSLCFGWGQFFLHLPWRSKYDNEHSPPQYGVYYFEGALWFCLGRETKCLHMPWDYSWVRTSLMLEDGTWEHEKPGDHKSFFQDEWQNKAWSEEHPYTYTRKNGETQHRVARITVEEREWRPRWFKWTSLFSRIRRTVNVEFNDEVGEGTGSWKGGAVGCSYELLEGETPEECLRRMESEREFKR